MATVSVQDADYDTAAEIAAMTAGRTDVGAVVTFSGLCRDDGGTLDALEIEHYPGMAEDEILRVCAEAEARWPLQGCRVIHRHGAIRPGDNIVLVVTASAHRVAAFAAADFLMDYLKSEAPFWKRNRRRADAPGDGGWVSPKASDEAALDRWR
ncbi:molybdenum cofactor biosynthesis protein MoaE [Lichenibacterium minor]|nr:molybdenum cofactor biosynthesis protein MoaE [Lichenibacterium minor]